MSIESLERVFVFARDVKVRILLYPKGVIDYSSQRKTRNV